MGRACNSHEKGCHPDACPACILTIEKEAIRQALQGLMEAHRALFRSSLFAAFQAGKSDFVKAWNIASRYVPEQPAAEEGK
jgi:hypothetical protein